MQWFLFCCQLFYKTEYFYNGKAYSPQFKEANGVTDILEFIFVCLNVVICSADGKGRIAENPFKCKSLAFLITQRKCITAFLKIFLIVCTVQ